MIIRNLIFVATLIVGTSPSYGQADADVRNVIHKLFTGMHNADSAMVHTVFMDDLTMATVGTNGNTGKQQLNRETGVADFLKAVGTKRPEPITEEIWNLVVQVDGEFAQAWCDYAFYVGKKFSHCGVDAFHLFKTEQGWKIFHIADTRRKDGCVIPDEIQKKYKE